MRILRFPKTIKLELPDHLRQVLDQVLEQHPEMSNDNELLLQALDDGIAAMNDGLKEPHKPPPTVETVAGRMQQRLEDMARDAEGNSELSIAASLRPFPRITKRYKDPRKEHVESYVATVIPKDVQDRLQMFLDTHPEADLESLLATLIGVGLERVEEDPKILKPDPAEEFAKLDRSSPPVTASVFDDELTLEGRLLRKLTKFLAAHPDAMNREHARKLLADLGAHRR